MLQFRRGREIEFGEVGFESLLFQGLESFGDEFRPAIVGSQQEDDCTDGEEDDENQYFPPQLWSTCFHSSALNIRTAGSWKFLRPFPCSALQELRHFWRLGESFLNKR
jgi:hypothetical protein